MITKQDQWMRNKIHMKALVNNVNGFKDRFEKLIKLGYLTLGMEIKIYGQRKISKRI